MTTSGSTFKTNGVLADGREILYYDQAPDRGGAPIDRRDLPPQSGGSELRLDRVMDEWVIVASHRQNRTFLPSPGECPLCPTQDGRMTEIPAADYEVVVFENRFPSLVEQPDEPRQKGLGRARPGLGRCEVICFSSDHETTFSRLPPGRLATISDALVDRTLELSSIPGVEYVLFFENRGEEIGVTLNHPHGQLYAYPFIPPRMEKALGVAGRFTEETGGCLSCRELENEIEDDARIVEKSEHFVAYVPFAARWPYEVRLASRSHVPSLDSHPPATRLELFSMQARILGVFDALFTTPMPYIAAMVQAPTRRLRDLAHLRVDIVSARRAEGRLKYLAGSETAAGTFINDIRPEQSAAIIRDRLSRAEVVGDAPTGR